MTLRARVLLDQRRSVIHWGLVALAVFLVVGSVAALRWTGYFPYGSDNDEYRIVAKTLVLKGTPSVGEIERSKYPLGYPALLAFPYALSLPVEPFALCLNILATVVLALMTVSGPGGWLPKLTAVIIALGSATLWSSVFSITPDVLLTLLAFWFVFVAERLRSHRVGVSTCVCIAAVLLKTAGIVLVVAVVVWLISSAPRSRSLRLAAPLVAALFVIAIQAFLGSHFPPHTTGYLSVFSMRDPYDASLGSASIGEILWRFVSRMGLVCEDAASSFSPLRYGALLGISLATLFLGFALWRARRMRAGFAALLVSYLFVMTLWPFNSPRFGLLLLPLICYGAKELVSAILQRTKSWRVLGLAGVTIGLGVHAAYGLTAVREDAAVERTFLAAIYQAEARVELWAKQHIPPGDGVASFDYREWMLRLGRPIFPLGYTSDAKALWMESGGRGAKWFIDSKMTYEKRVQYSALLRDAKADAFVPVYVDSVFTVYEIRDSAFDAR